MAVKTVFFLYLFCLWLQVQAQQGSLVLTSIGEQCFGQKVTLTCTHPDPFQDPAKYIPQVVSWAENGVVLDLSVSATGGRFTPTRLNSTASTLSFTVTEEFHANRVVNCSCFLTLTGGGGREESDPPITMDVNAPPKIMSTPNDPSGLLEWRPLPSDCSGYQYIYNLNWTRIGDGSTGTNSTTENWYNFTGMPEGKYTASLTTRVTNFSNLSESVPTQVQFSLTDFDSSTATVPPTTGNGTVVIAIVIVVVIVNAAIIAIATFVVICCYRNKKKRISQSCSPVTESEYSEAPNKKQEAENVELGQTRQELDKKQEAENQIQYADIDFSGQRPIAPPPLETVVYTQTVEQFRNARKNRPIPPLPPAKTEEEEEEEKQLAQEAAEITADFKAQVVAILQASKLVYRSLDPEEPVVGTYQKKTFVANFVHAPGGKEILSSEVEAIIKDRELQSTDKGFLVATTDSISGPWLEYLEKHNCHFIGLSCKGGVKKEMLLKKLSFCFPESSSF